jgi:hypothetical protein
MRLPGVPGPRDVLAVAERAGELVEQLFAAVPRLTALLDTAGTLLADAALILARIDETRAAADAVLLRADAAATSADAFLVAIAETQARLVEMLDRLEPPLTALQPTLERLAETTDPREVDALVSLVDRLPLLAEQVERDVVPVMRTLGSVAPDLHELLIVSRELNEMLAKVPGLSRIRKSGD